MFIGVYVHLGIINWLRLIWCYSQFTTLCVRNNFATQFVFFKRLKTGPWQFSHFLYHSWSTLAVIADFKSHLSVPKSHCWHLKSSLWQPHQEYMNASISRFSTILSFRHCSKLNPPFFYSPSSFFPSFLFLPCWMHVVDTEASGIMESLVSGLYFWPGLLGLCIIVAEEKEEGRLCATDSNEGCLFIF